MRILLFLLFFCGNINLPKAQNPNLGEPLFNSYPKAVYQSGAQNWDIAQDSKGIMYFANNNGLLRYTGAMWKTYPLPNATIVRSLAIDEDGAIYVGGQNEFGKFQPDEHGELTFHSLKKLIPEPYRGFEDVWDIVLEAESIFFRSSNKLFRIHQGECTVFDSNVITFLGSAHGKVLMQDPGVGLLQFVDNQLIKIVGSEILNGTLISGTLGANNGTIISTFGDGLFNLRVGGLSKFRNDAEEFLKSNGITSADMDENGHLALGTDFGGVLIMDSDGISLFHLDRRNDLLNNKTFSTFFDKDQNLWLGVDNGINQILLNSPFTHIYPDDELEGAGFATKVYKDHIYFGTSNGLYATQWKKHYDPFDGDRFKLLEKTRGQNWSLDIVDDALFMGHNDGAFLIDGKKATSIYNSTGVWNAEILRSQSEYAIAGTFENFALFKKKANRWQFTHDFEGWSESSRFVEQDENGNIWMAHPYRGVFKITLENKFEDLNVSQYGEESGLPSDLQNHLFRINNEIIFCAERGTFLYDEEQDAFEPYEAFNKIFGSETKIRRLFESPNGDIWFVTKDEFGVLNITDSGLERQIRKKVFPQFQDELNPGFESIYAFDENNVFICNDRGFLHYNSAFEQVVDSTFELFLNEVKITGDIDSVVFAGYEISNSEIPVFSANENALLFHFTGIDFVGIDQVLYQFYLEGFEEHWHDWTPSGFKEYTNLSAGDYIFKVRAKNQNGIISSEKAYPFEILAPWYATNLAILIYAILVLLTLFWIINKYQKKYYGLKEDRDKTIKDSAQKIGKLKEEKVQAELEFKKRELISTTMHLVQKNETIGKIKEQLSVLKKQNKDQQLTREIQRMINMLQMDEVRDDGWEQFLFHFNQLHGDFYNRLDGEFPELTPKDLKLCTYLRMNLSTKEIASLMNVTTRGVEASRYRLRKKINLEKEANLTEFMMKY